MKDTATQKLIKNKQKRDSLKLLKTLMSKEAWKDAVKEAASRGYTYCIMLIEMEECDIKKFVEYVESLGLMSYYNNKNEGGMWVVTIDWKKR